MASGRAEEESVDEALEALYAAPREGFTKARDALAKRLEGRGDTEAAAALRARRKPTQLAAVLNQLARRHAGSVAKLVDGGRELARAQRQALRGEADSGLKEAIAEQRSAIAAITAEAAAMMRELGMKPEGHVDAIARALRTAMVDPTVGAALEEGRLGNVPDATVGAFGESERGEEGGARRKATARGRGEGRAKADAQAKAKARAKAEAEQRAEAEGAERRARDLEARAAALGARVEAIKARLAEATRAAREAGQKAQRARDAAARLTRRERSER